MGQLVDLERQWVFSDPSGNRYWGGLLRTGQILDVVSAEASAAIAPGTPVKYDASGSAWPRWDLATTSEPIKSKIAVKNTTAAAEVGLIGVALEYILPGQAGRIAGRGCWTSVKCNATLGGSSAIGAAVIQDSGVASQVKTAALSTGTYANISPTLVGLGLGWLRQVNGTGAGTTGSTTQLGIEVHPF